MDPQFDDMVSLSMVDSGETLCGGCSGACCRRDVVLELSLEEASVLRDAGTELGGYILALFPEDEALIGAAYQTYEDYFDALAMHPRRRKRFRFPSAEENEARNLLTSRQEGRYAYLLETDCAFLDDSVSPPLCTIYDQPARPSTCGEFTVGGGGCKTIREESPHAVAVHLRTSQQEAS